MTRSCPSAPASPARTGNQPQTLLQESLLDLEAVEASSGKQTSSYCGGTQVFKPCMAGTKCVSPQFPDRCAGQVIAPSLQMRKQRGRDDR